MIWFSGQRPTLDVLNSTSPNTLVEHLDIQFEDVGDDYLTASMPVDKRTHQPYGILHGGASVVLAETLGSTGAWLCTDMSKYRVVGLDINANHLRAATSGRVTATATPRHIGRSTHVWAIDQWNDAGKLCCVSRITMAIIDL
ncbi:MAG: hotdog fold thioesterase [Pseudomonadota bacterium]